MKKELVICISPHQHKYYLEPHFEDMPKEIKEELIEAIAQIAERVQGVMTLGFYEDGNIYIEQTSEEDVFVDEIGTALEIKRFQTEYKELLKSLKMWYMIYRTVHGQVVKTIVLLQSKGLNEQAVLEQIEKQYGEEARVFAKTLME